MREGWSEINLGDTCEIQQGRTLAVAEMDGGPIPVYGANGIIGYHSKWNSEIPVVALGCRGSCGTVHTVRDRAWLANNVMAVRPRDPGRLAVEFLALLLAGADLITSGAISGQVQPQITRSSLAPLKVDLPPVAEQRRIVDLFSSVDGYIAALRKNVELLTTSRSAVLRNLLTAGQNEWPLTTLASVARWTSGGTPTAGNPAYYGGGIPWVVIGDLTETWVSESSATLTDEGLSKSSAKWVPANAVMLAMYGASIGRTGIAAVPLTTNQAIASAIVNEDLIDPWFLLAFLQSQKSAFVAAGQGAAQANISQGIIKSWPIRLPPLREQRRIVEVARAMQATSSAAVQTLSTAVAVRSELLRDLLSGDHEIPSSYDQLMGAL